MKRLELLFMIVLGGLYFVLKWNIVIAFASTCIVDLLVGYCYYIKNVGGVGKVKYKVKYKGYIYCVDALDKLKIEWIKFILAIKRTKRRITLFIPENIIYFVNNMLDNFWHDFLLFRYLL